MRLYQTTTEFNCGVDLHARQMYVCVVDREGKVLVHKNIRDNDFEFFFSPLAKTSLSMALRRRWGLVDRPREPVAFEWDPPRLAVLFL